MGLGLRVRVGGESRSDKLRAGNCEGMGYTPLWHCVALGRRLVVGPVTPLAPGFGVVLPLRAARDCADITKAVGGQSLTTGNSCRLSFTSPTRRFKRSAALARCFMG